MICELSGRSRCVAPHSIAPVCRILPSLHGAGGSPSAAAAIMVAAITPTARFGPVAGRMKCVLSGTDIVATLLFSHSHASPLSIAPTLIFSVVAAVVVMLSALVLIFFVVVSTTTAAVATVVPAVIAVVAVLLRSPSVVPMLLRCASGAVTLTPTSPAAAPPPPPLIAYLSPAACSRCGVALRLPSAPAARVPPVPSFILIQRRRRRRPLPLKRVPRRSRRRPVPCCSVDASASPARGMVVPHAVITVVAVIAAVAAVAAMVSVVVVIVLPAALPVAAVREGVFTRPLHAHKLPKGRRNMYR